MYNTLIMNKNCHQVSGFKIWCQIGVGETSFSKLPNASEFQNIGSKRCLFFFLFLIQFSHFFESLKNVFCRLKLSLKFWLLKQTYIVSCWKSYSHSPVFGLHGMGWMGMTGYQKFPSILFILFKYIENIYMYLYT